MLGAIPSARFSAPGVGLPTREKLADMVHQEEEDYGADLVDNWADGPPIQNSQDSIGGQPALIAETQLQSSQDATGGQPALIAASHVHGKELTQADNQPPRPEVGSEFSPFKGGSAPGG